VNIARNRLVLWCLLAAVGIVAGMVRGVNQRRKVQKAMAARTDAPERLREACAVLRRPEVAEEIRAMLEQVLRTDLGNLLPSDRFGHELGFGHAGDERLLKLVTEVEGRYDVSLPDVRTCLEMSVGDFVELVDKGAGRAPHNP